MRDKLLLNVLNRLAILPPIDRLVALLAFRSTETVSPAWDLFDIPDQQAIHYIMCLLSLISEQDIRVIGQRVGSRDCREITYGDADHVNRTD